MKQIADIHGTEVYSDLRLFYLLSDYSSFDKLSDESLIVKELQKGGYGNLLLTALNSRDKFWRNHAKSYLSAFICANSFDRSLVEYIAESMAYGLGLSAEPNNQSNTGESDVSTTSNTWFDSFTAFWKNASQSVLLSLKKTIRWIQKTWRSIVYWFKNLPSFWKYVIYVIGALLAIAVVVIVVYYLLLFVVALFVLPFILKEK